MKTWNMRPEPGAEKASSKVAIIHQHPFPIEPSGLRDLVGTILEEEGKVGLEISVLLCDDPTIAALNETYRGYSRPTDVLAFPQRGVEESPPLSEAETVGSGSLLGDIVVSVDTAISQASACAWSVEEEVGLLVLHGLLHLLGYGDTNETERQAMQEAEERYFQTFFGRSVPRPLET